MNSIQRVLLVAGLLLPMICQADFYVAGTPSANGHNLKVDHPLQYRINPNATLRLEPGTLYGNLSQYAKRQHWTMHWTASKRIPVIKSSVWAGNGFPAVAQDVLGNFPMLSAKINLRRHIIWVSPSRASTRT